MAFPASRPGASRRGAARRQPKKQRAQARAAAPAGQAPGRRADARKGHRGKPGTMARHRPRALCTPGRGHPEPQYLVAQNVAHSATYGNGAREARGTGWAAMNRVLAGAGVLRVFLGRRARILSWWGAAWAARAGPSHRDRRHLAPGSVPSRKKTATSVRHQCANRRILLSAVPLAQACHARAFPGAAPPKRSVPAHHASLDILAGPDYKTAPPVGK